MPSISVPLNPLAAHIGQGIVQVHVQTPLSVQQGLNVLRHYEVQAAYNIGGPYLGYSNNIFNTPDGFLHNFPVGLTIYMQIRAVAMDGSISDWVQVAAATTNLPTVVMQCRAPRNSQIPNNAMFCVAKKPHRLVGFLAKEEIVFTN